MKRPPALKRFSQNFLVDRSISRRIVEAAALERGESVLEIGPGRGALSELLAVRAGRLRLAEVDRALSWELAARYADEERIEVHHGDVTRSGLEPLLRTPSKERFSIVANLPYHITTPILLEMMRVRALLRSATVMMQKEVAERLAAPPGSRAYGSLSVQLARVAEAKTIFDVPPGAFRPRPAVMSTVLRIDFLDQPRCQVRDERVFERVVRGAFNQRRKTLRNALKNAGFQLEQLEPAAQQLDIDLKRRGETLSLIEFAQLADALTAPCRLIRRPHRAPTPSECPAARSNATT